MQGILILLGILAISLLGGAGGTNHGLFSPSNGTPEQQKISIERKIADTQGKINELKTQQEAEEERKNASIYKGTISLAFANRSNDPSQEYLTIKASGSSEKKTKVSGWKLKSLSTGSEVVIPKGTYLFFSGIINQEQDIYLAGGETMYLVTGLSPVGVSFLVNKCSGYMQQFQTFIPYLNNICPLPKNENLSSIPRTVKNDSCFDYLEFMPSCKVQVEPLPNDLSYECKTFIQEKVNYSSCINTHKGDYDFSQKEWRAYLKRSDHVWKNSKETIVLYDEAGKIVDTLKY